MATFFFGIGEGLRGESPEILAKGFGIRALKTALFIPPRGIRSDRDRQFDDIEFIEEDADATSFFDTPVLDQVVIQGGSFVDVTDPEKPTIPYETVTLQAVLLEVTQSKNIVTTALQGRDGTVKEFISDGDFAITMTGLVFGEMDENNEIQNIGNVYPEADIKKLITICKVSDSIDIVSNFLGLFTDSKRKNTRYVITDYTFNQLEGTRNIQPFQISMLSDVPIQLNELETE